MISKALFLSIVDKMSKETCGEVRIFCAFGGIFNLGILISRNRSAYVWFEEKIWLQTWSVGNFGFNEFGGFGFRASR